MSPKRPQSKPADSNALSIVSDRTGIFRRQADGTTKKVASLQELLQYVVRTIGAMRTLEEHIEMFGSADDDAGCMAEGSAKVATLDLLMLLNPVPMGEQPVAKYVVNWKRFMQYGGATSRNLVFPTAAAQPVCQIELVLAELANWLCGVEPSQSHLLAKAETNLFRIGDRLIEFVPPQERRDEASPRETVPSSLAGEHENEPIACSTGNVDSDDQVNLEARMQRFAQAVGDEHALRILSIVERTDWPGDRKMDEILRLDRRMAGKNSVEWAKLLGVTSAAVRGYKTWKLLRSNDGEYRPHADGE